MGHDRDRDTNRPARIPGSISRRVLLKSAVAAGGFVGLAAASPAIAFARQVRQDDTSRTGTSPTSALALAQSLNRTKFNDLPPLAVEHAKMIIASTIASAAPGSLLPSARIIRDLAKEHGGRPEATVWFDGAKLPVHEAAHVNATLSDAAASDDSDIRTTAHTGTSVAAVGLAIAERTGATGQDVLCAIVTGYEAAGRIGEARRGGRGGVHASQIVAFGGTVAAAKLLKLTDVQMAHAICMTAVTMGGLSIGTNSLAREYMGGNASFCAVNAARGVSVSVCD